MKIKTDGSMKILAAAAIAAAVLLLIIILLSPCPPGARPELVTTTNIISSVVDELSGGKVKTMTLIPPGQCPGYSDLKVSHLNTVRETGIIFAQGYEGYLEDIRRSVGGGLKVYSFPVEGSWLIPGIQIELAALVKEALAEIFPGEKDVFRDNFRAFEAKAARLDKRAERAFSEAAPAGMKAICSEHLAEFLSYLGLEITAVYGRKEDLTAARMRELVNRGSAEGVSIVIDNYQSGADTGAALAADLGAAHAVISNFPDAFPGTPTLSATLEDNIARLARALKRENGGD